jgi:hypothetical protein
MADRREVISEIKKRAESLDVQPGFRALVDLLKQLSAIEDTSAIMNGSGDAERAIIRAKTFREIVHLLDRRHL